MSKNQKTGSSPLFIAGVIVIIVMALLLAIMSITKQSNNTADGNSTNTQGNKAEVSYRYEELDSDQPALCELYSMCCRQPESLASTISAFPSLLQASGISAREPADIDDLMDDKNTGYSCQQAMLKELKTAFEQDDTVVEFKKLNGQAKMLGMFEREGADPDNPVPHLLTVKWQENMNLQDAKTMIVTIHTADGGTETGYYDMASGFARVIQEENS